MKNNPLKVLGYIVLLIVLFWHSFLPAIISNSFEKIIGIELEKCADSFFCNPYPNAIGWSLVVAIYLIFLAIILLIKLLINKEKINKQTGISIFIIIFLFSFGSLSFLGNFNNYSPLRCVIVNDGKDFPEKTHCYTNLAEGHQKGHPPNEEYCSRIPLQSDRNNCYAQLSKILQRPALCDLITDENWKNVCIENIFNNAN